MQEDFLELENFKNKKIFNRYRCLSKLGKGSFGNVFIAEYNQEYFALKIEMKNKKIDLLENEAEIMDYLQGTNIPYVEFYSSTEDYNILVMELLGKSLSHYIKHIKCFSVKTVCMLGDQMLTTLKYIHDRDIIHRDIKPDNFCMGINNYSKYVYLIDFGLAKKYRSSTTLLHYPLVNKKCLTGTPRYASINALKGMEQSRRDDLESLSYVLIYFLKGELPWQNINAKTKDERNKKILEKKMEISSAQLCEMLPIEFKIFLDYTKNLQYTETPDYQYLQNLLMSLMKNNDLTYNYIYDWTNGEAIEIHPFEDINKNYKNKRISANNVLVYDMKRKNKINNYMCPNKNYDIYRNTNIKTIYQNKDVAPLALHKSNTFNNNDKEEQVNINCSAVCNIF